MKSNMTNWFLVIFYFGDSETTATDKSKRVGVKDYTYGFIKQKILYYHLRRGFKRDYNRRE